MRRVGIIAFVLGVLFQANAFVIDRRMSSVTGDARIAAERSITVTNILFDVELPADGCHAFTVCGWFRLVYAETTWLTTQAFYCPENINKSNPDLLAGVAGYPSNGQWNGSAGTNITTLGGSITVAEFPWTPYLDPVSSNRWPRGVYTLAGWTSNELTVSLGGTQLVVSAGAFNINSLPGPASSNAVIISGSGPVCLGISRTPDAQFFSMVDGVVDGASAYFTADSIVTNEISFCAWRFLLNDTEHIYRSDIARIDIGQCMGSEQTNSMPRTARAFGKHGIYRVGFSGVGASMRPVTVDAFDIRVFCGKLTDEELCRIHDNGVQEIRRRGIPQWRQN